jgi:hypothetical protein
MKWHPGYMSAPHSYATARLSLVLSGTWWVNSGEDFDPGNAVAVSAGGFVRRVAHTPHYDGVKREAKEPAVIALFGIAPVKLQLVDPDRRLAAQSDSARQSMAPEISANRRTESGEANERTWNDWVVAWDSLSRVGSQPCLG